MKTTQQVKREVIDEEIVGITCDWCKKPFKREFVECSGYGIIDVSFGYPSGFDGKDFDGEVCDECFEKYLKPHLRERVA